MHPGCATSTSSQYHLILKLTCGWARSRESRDYIRHIKIQTRSTCGKIVDRVGADDGILHDGDRRESARRVTDNGTTYIQQRNKKGQ